VLHSPGRPLDAVTRAAMESRLGHDLSGVRIHDDVQAAASTRLVDAHAYTVGRHVVLGAGMSFHTPEGRRTLAHELTHVLQQRASWSHQGVSGLAIERPDSPHELAAHQAAQRVAGLGPAAPIHRPVVQRQPLQQRLREEVCEPEATRQPERPGECDYRRPELCPTYEEWLGAFLRLRTFPAPDAAPGGTARGHIDVLGEAAASHESSAPPGERQPPPVGAVFQGEGFIDHPTDEWVRTCLPKNLRETAYRLPTDCADIAVVLRHVWLSAHKRTERYAGWVVGDAAGQAARERTSKLIQAVYSGNVGRMLNAYRDASGKPLRSFDTLHSMLHPGDVLVWEHHEGGLGTRRTGGHTQTIAGITWQAGQIQKLTLLAGNQPLPSDPENPRAQEIVEHLEATSGGRRVPTLPELGKAPGRRIEVQTLESGDLHDWPLPPDEELVWTWHDRHTTLVAAGPPAAAPRPKAQSRERGRPAQRRLADWLPSLRAADRQQLSAVFTAALQELRATVEGGSAVTDDEAGAIGTAAGERLWALAKRAGGLGESHAASLQELRTILHALGGIDVKPPPDRPRAAAVAQTFRAVGDALELAARGATTLDFPTTGGRRRTVVKVLLTGFDPWNVDDPSRPPRSGEWNPSGAAVLALDGERVDAGQGTEAAVQGVVLPVSFEEFRGNLVERILGPRASDLDAVLTISLDPGLGTDAPVRLERYAVGVHEEKGKLEPIPAAGGGAGPPIVEATTALEPIAAATARSAGRGRSAIPSPGIGEDLTFAFPGLLEANDALAAFGLPPTRSSVVTISDESAIRTIASTASRKPGQTGITFRPRPDGPSFNARLLSGPGGNFLSNEVSYRVLRFLAERGQTSTVSFHTHVPGTEPIPQDTDTRKARRARAAALGTANTVRDRLIATLRRIVAAVARQIVTSRKAERRP
jgi:pyrrolidone-carboxylate peptidase